jgi:transcriptional regulator with XRE-family HTH domain
MALTGGQHPISFGEEHRSPEEASSGTPLTFGAAVREIRTLKRISQAMIEQVTGIKREYLSKIETGALKNPTLTTIKKLAAALGTTASVLLAVTEGGGANHRELSMSIQDLAQFKAVSREEGATVERHKIISLINEYTLKCRKNTKD